jgi:hypothetical protein
MDEATKIVVNVLAYGISRSGVVSAHTSVLIARWVKYIAKSAAKNISSLESHTMVPTETMFGRLICPCARGAEAVVVVTGLL